MHFKMLSMKGEKIRNMVEAFKIIMG